MFALEHTYHARWLSVYICDIMTLFQKHPFVLHEFNAGKFVVHKTSNKFSAMAIDLCHEQNNAIIKGSGEAVGLMSDPGALKHWMVADSKVARMV